MLYHNRGDEDASPIVKKYHKNIEKLKIYIAFLQKFVKFISVLMTERGG